MARRSNTSTNSGRSGGKAGKRPAAARSSARRGMGRYLPVGAAIRMLLHPLLLRCYLLLLVFFCAWVVYLDATIRSSFEGNKWQLPARVYARPLELFVGSTLSPSELENELRLLGYRQGSGSQPGTYYRGNRTFTVYSRGHRFWDGEELAQQVSVEFGGGRIATMEDLDRNPVSVLRLEPMEIGAIYPNHREDRVLVRLEEVPPVLLAALVAVEDHRFYQHHGVSVAAITRAALRNISEGSLVQGGSTITQQLVKNFYLTRERSFTRKITEAIMALLLDYHYDKEAILEAYLNEVYLGQSGARAVHGFGLAAQHYFNRPLTELSIDRLALLIAIVRGPAYYDPWKYPERALQRRNRVIEALLSHQLLLPDDADWARAQPLNLGKSSRSLYEFPAYIDLVRRQLGDWYSAEDLTSNGLKIYTSFDPIVQRYAEQAVAERLDAAADDALQAAVVVIHPDTGDVLAMVGGNRPRFAGFNRALDAVRSVGSLVKPFVYAEALSRSDQYTQATLLDDSAINMVMGEQVWQPRNYDREDHGQVPLVTALAKSYNQATARLGMRLGIENIIETLHAFGMQKSVEPLPALTIGALELSPFEVAGMYQSIAANGFRAPLKAIRSVLDADDQPLQHFPLTIERAADEKTVYLIQDALRSVGKFGSARGAAQRLPVDLSFAGKTGTSNAQRDSWFAGFTGDLLAVVWLGHDDNTETRFTGASGALPLWSGLVARASKRALQQPLVDGLEKRWINIETGELSHRHCANAYEVAFVDGTAPQGRAKCQRIEKQRR